MSDVTAAIIGKLTALEARLAALEQRETTPLSGIEAGLTMTGPLAFGAGSAASPALHVVGDTNTGIWQSAADNLDISTGGTNRVNISSAGLRLPAGDLSFPQNSALQIKRGAAYNSVLWQDSSDDELHLAQPNNAPLTLSVSGNTIQSLSATGTRFSKFIGLNAGGDLTLDASGAITVTASRHRVDTYGGAASDDLESISGGDIGDLLLLSSVNNARDVTVKDNGTGFYLAGDCVLSTNVDFILLMKAGASVWVEISRSDNA